MMAVLNEALSNTWTGVYVRALAVILLYGAAMHVGNMLGLTGRPWIETPLLHRVMDVVLLSFNIVVAAGLWLRKPWGVVAFVVGILLLQIVPYTLFRSHFIQAPEDVKALNGLVVTEILLLALLITTILLKK